MTGRKIIRAFVAGVLLLMFVFLIFRNYVLHTVLDKIADRLNKKYNLELRTKEASFSGMITVEMKDISITSENGDTLLKLDSLSATPSIPSLLLLNVRIK